MFQHFAAVVYLNKTVNDLCISLEIRFFLKDAFSVFGICKGLRKGRKKKFVTTVSGTGIALHVVVRKRWSCLVLSNHVIGYLPRFLSVLCGRRRDSSSVCEWCQRDRPSFQER